MTHRNAQMDLGSAQKLENLLAGEIYTSAPRKPCSKRSGNLADDYQECLQAWQDAQREARIIVRGDK